MLTSLTRAVSLALSMNDWSRRSRAGSASVSTKTTERLQKTVSFAAVGPAALCKKREGLLRIKDFLHPQWRIPQRVGIGQRELLSSDRFAADLQAIAVNELVGQRHDVGVHAILTTQVDHRVRMGFRQPLEQTDVETAAEGSLVADLERQVSVRARPAVRFKANRHTKGGS